MKEMNKQIKKLWAKMQQIETEKVTNKFSKFYMFFHFCFVLLFFCFFFAFFCLGLVCYKLIKSGFVTKKKSSNKTKTFDRKEKDQRQLGQIQKHQ